MSDEVTNKLVRKINIYVTNNEKYNMERVSWIQNGSNYKRVEGNVSNVDTVPRGVYNVGLSMTGWYLERTADEFVFNFKVYGLQSKFIQHVLTAFENTKGNFGILLNGTKGTGKSIVAKILANKFNLPIVVVKSFGENNTGLIEFLASFNFDCVFFFDEFEKNFSDRDSSILQIMDGVYTSEYRRIFLLTTNETKINDNLISRPSRLRYIREFGNLEPEITREYLNDTLNDKSRIEDVVDFVDTLQISTIDILKSIVEEINIFGFDKFMETKSFFNIKTAAYTYRTKRVFIRNEEELHEYSVDKFLADLKLFEKRPNFNDYSNKEEYDKAWAEYRNTIKHEPEFRVISNLQKSFRSFKVGDYAGYYSGERVIFVDHDRQVFVTKDYDDDDYYYYFIENPNQRPSLTNDYLTNPYTGLM